MVVLQLARPPHTCLHAPFALFPALCVRNLSGFFVLLGAMSQEGDGTLNSTLSSVEWLEVGYHPL